ncbi:hypothetical protein RFI_13013 [Reticulomyxa filosa]|uniref:EF-hand domain-containing protein n=1 Tax=Reticulomyxa filosa TaxID=46433 RepID=X6NCU6_RETFI|nr:hypothetical protein RFI_13013 [Reticulomyxa filosa]|eukprot:ETO24145.1 hypothetical protein RFI_13013 [Reticulomyxa filosa]
MKQLSSSNNPHFHDISMDLSPSYGLAQTKAKRKESLSGAEEKKDDASSDVESNGKSIGSVDFSHFLIMMAHKMSNPADLVYLKEAFELFLKDKSFSSSSESKDIVDVPKLIRLLTQCGECLEEKDIQWLLQNVDKNQTGVVDYHGCFFFM